MGAGGSFLVGKATGGGGLQMHASLPSLSHCLHGIVVS